MKIFTNDILTQTFHLFVIQVKKCTRNWIMSFALIMYIFLSMIISSYITHQKHILLCYLNVNNIEMKKRD